MAATPATPAMAAYPKNGYNGYGGYQPATAMAATQKTLGKKWRLRARRRPQRHVVEHVRRRRRRLRGRRRHARHGAEHVRRRRRRRLVTANRRTARARKALGIAVHQERLATRRRGFAGKMSMRLSHKDDPDNWRCDAMTCKEESSEGGFVRVTAGRQRVAQRAHPQATFKPRGRATRPMRQSVSACRIGG